MNIEIICPRCRRVCFSEEQFETHPCFDASANLDAEIALANQDDAVDEEPWWSDSDTAREMWRGKGAQ